MARRGPRPDKVRVAVLWRVPLAERSAAGQPRLTMLREKRRELKLIEIDGLDVGVAELDGADVQVGGHEQAGIAGAGGRVDAGARLRRGARIGARPAIEPGRGRLRRAIGTERGRTEPLLAQRSRHRRAPGDELLR